MISNSSVLHRCSLCWQWEWIGVASGGTHTLTHLHRHSHNNGRRAKGRHVTTSSLRIISSSWLLLYSLFLLSVNFTLNQTFHNNTSIFCQNTIFLLLFIVFLLQNMYRLFRTTTKIQYPIYMQFLLFNIHQFIRWILLEFLFLLIVPLSQIQSIWVLVGGRGTNKYIGQDVKKLKTRIVIISKSR